MAWLLLGTLEVACEGFLAPSTGAIDSDETLPAVHIVKISELLYVISKCTDARGSFHSPQWPHVIMPTLPGLRGLICAGGPELGEGGRIELSEHRAGCGLWRGGFLQIFAEEVWRQSHRPLGPGVLSAADTQTVVLFVHFLRMKE